MAPATEIEDPDAFIDLLRRSPLLEALRSGGLDRRDVEERLHVSRATSHRHTRLLGELGALEKADGEFRLTEAGELLANAVVRFKRDAEAALRIGPILEAIRNAPVPIDGEAFAGATVTSAEHGDPHAPVARFVALVRNTERLRGIDMDAVAPIYMDEIQGRIVGGMETEAVGFVDVTRDILNGYPEKCTEACASGNLAIWLTDDLPISLAIFDDSVGVGVTERDTRTLRTFAETDSPVVREWAEDVYESYRAEAVRIAQFTEPAFERAVEALRADG